jgi:hypothetical protein
MGQMNDEAKFARIEALLHATAERGNQMELRFNRRMDRAEERMGKAELRMEKFDRRIEATQKLVQYGMKLLVQIGEEQKKTRVELRELAKAQKAWLDSMRGGNGNGHRRVN